MARNQYEGRCYLCQRVVEAGTGHFERVKGPQRWRVKHASVPGDGRVTCNEAKQSFTYDDYLETIHPFSEEAFQS